MEGRDNTDGPDWLREAATAVRDETVRFLITALQTMVRPRRFAAAWVAGETRALNPIGYVSTALAVSAAVNSAVGELLHFDQSSGLWSSIATATLPYIYYAVLGVLSHAVIRLTGKSRSLRASMAVALYIGGGPGLLQTLVMYVALTLYGAVASGKLGANFQGAPVWAMPILYILALGVSGYFMMSLAAGLRGLHGTGRLRAVAAILVAFIVSGILLGQLQSVYEFKLGVPSFVFSPGGQPPIAIEF